MELEFAEAWQATPTLVVSRTLDAVEGAELVRDVSDVPDRDGPCRSAGRRSPRPCSIASTSSAPIVYPTAVGGGTPFFPAGTRLNLKLVESRRFESGPVLLRYQRA